MFVDQAVPVETITASPIEESFFTKIFVTPHRKPLRINETFDRALRLLRENVRMLLNIVMISTFYIFSSNDVDF